MTRWMKNRTQILAFSFLCLLTILLELMGGNLLTALSGNSKYQKKESKELNLPLQKVPFSYAHSVDPK